MSLKSLTLLLAGGVLCVAWNAQQPATVAAQAPRPWTLKIEPAQVATDENSNGPQLSSSARGTILSWLESNEEGSLLKFSERTASGWSAPVKVASGEDWFVTEADTPSVVRLS